MEGEVLRDDQWERLREFVPGGRKGKRGPRSDGRWFIDALLWVGRSGGRWRDLPEKFGPYQTIKRRYYRWIEQGVFERIFAAVSDDPDIDWLAIDATVIRAQAQPTKPVAPVRKTRIRISSFLPNRLGARGLSVGYDLLSTVPSVPSVSRAEQAACHAGSPG